VIAETYEASGGQVLLYAGGLSQQIYGGVFLRSAVDPTKPHGIRVDKIMPYNGFAVWRPINTNRILEMYVAIPIDKAEAALAYGVATAPSRMRWSTWSTGPSSPTKCPSVESSFDFINFILDMTRQAASVSPIAFGEDEGSQRSGVTLTLCLWPLLQQVKTTRIYWRAMLLELHSIMLTMARYRDINNRYSAQLTTHTAYPNFYELVPQDR
jgi:hypothetical protein